MRGPIFMLIINPHHIIATYLDAQQEGQEEED